MKFYLLIIVLTLLLNLEGKNQNVGDKAPDFTLQQVMGDNFTLSNQTGKVVFIFWLGYACPYCKSAAPSINSEIINAFKDRTGFVAVGIDTWDGSLSQVQGFQSQTGLEINYLMKGSPAAQSWKTTYDRLSVVDSSGKIVFKGTQGAASDIGNAKNAIENALQLATSNSSIDEVSSLFVNYPNPFSTQTTIQFKLSQSSQVSINVYDVSGKKVRELSNEKFPSGENIIRFSKGNLEHGIYFLRMKNDGQVSTLKMIVQ